MPLQSAAGVSVRGGGPACRPPPGPATRGTRARAHTPTKIVAEMCLTAGVYFCISRSGWELAPAPCCHLLPGPRPWKLLQSGGGEMALYRARPLLTLPLGPPRAPWDSLGQLFPGCSPGRWGPWGVGWFFSSLFPQHRRGQRVRQVGQEGFGHMHWVFWVSSFVMWACPPVSTRPSPVPGPV